MKILVLGPDFFDIVGNVGTALSRLGHSVKTLQFKNFADQCGYWIKKAHKFGVGDFAKKYEDKINATVEDMAASFKPDLCLVLNGELIRGEMLAWLKNQNIKLGLILVDSILRLPQLEKNLAYFDNLFSFDPRDEKYILDKHGLTCGYFPMFYNNEVFFPVDGTERDIDISFVGTPTANRLSALNEVARYVKKHNLKLVVFGRHWDERYFWKKHSFSRKYSPLAEYVHNQTIQPAGAAQLYRRSKICMNIHITEHEGINPRTFEILATKSFEVVDFKPKLMDLLDVGKDLVAYHSQEEMISLIDHYLHNSKTREEIAGQGYESARNNYSIEKVVGDILARI